MSEEHYYKIDPRESALPKWAQEMMNGHRATIRSLMSELEVEVTDTNTFVKTDSYTPGVENEPLRKNAKILFCEPEERNSEYEVHMSKGVLVVYHMGFGGLQISPKATNVLEVKAVR